jgi:predicted PurR-regulated permease PerM
MAEVPDFSAPFKRRVLIGTLIVIALIVLFYFLFNAIYILLLIFAGVLLAVLLTTLSEALRTLIPMPHGLALAVVLITLVGASVLSGWLIAPRIAEQVEQLSQQIPEAVETLRERMMRYQWARWVAREAPDTPPATVVMQQAPGFLTTTIGAIFGLVVVLFVGIYLAVEPQLYTNGVLRLLPAPHRARGAEVLGAVGYTLRWWLLGQFVAMAFVGISTAVGLWLLGIPLAMTFGLLAFTLDFVPNFGPIIAAIPALLIALVESPQKFLWVMALYFVVQQVESYVITPVVQRRVVHLPPVLTISAQVLMGILIGPLGLILATPLMAATLVVVKMLYVEETLGDEIDTPDDHLPPEKLPPVPQ